MADLISYTLQQVFRICLSDGFDYTVGLTVIVGVLGLVYSLMGVRRRR